MFKSFVLCLWLALAWASSAAQAPTATPDGDQARTSEAAVVYAGPGHTYAPTAELPEGFPLRLIERNRIGNWLHIEAASATIMGWVQLGYLSLPEAFQLNSLPIAPFAADADLSRISDPALKTLYAAPIVPRIHADMCAVAQLGIANGADPQSVSKVGDSNSASEFYLAPIGLGQYDLRMYGFLQASVDWFAASFVRPSQAAKVGMNAASVFDPLWANPNTCGAGVAPLACEYEQARPIAAVIMFGINDTLVLNSDGYEAQLRLLIEESLARGIVPFVVAFSAAPDVPQMEQVVRFNSIALRLSQAYRVPFINFWAAAQALYRNGIGDDDIHLTQSGASFVLGYNEARYGLTLHNLLVLNALDAFRSTCGLE